MKKFITFSIFLFISVFLSTTIFAQSGAGKLAGKITDTDTEEALIGANVVILNTSLGAACDLDGNYFILNITPGTYDVKISFVGYSSKIIKDVRIIPGVTYELNTTLSPGIAMEEIVVSGVKFFEEKATNTVKVVDAEQIARLPVRGVENFAALQAGVVKSDGSGGAAGNAEINVRGGRGNEVVYVVDGVVQNDQMYGKNQSQISNAAIEQISFQVGGYEAKYGQAQSGIVTVTTKSGTPKFTVFGDALTSSFTDDFGYNIYALAVGGPIIPGNKDMTFFISGERGWFKDGEPSANGINFGSTGYSAKAKENNTDATWRISARTNFNLGAGFNLQVGGNYNDWKSRLYDYDYAKNNSLHNAIRLKDNIALNTKLSQNIGASSFWNLIVGYQKFTQEEGDGIFFDRLEEYGDTVYNKFIPRQADQTALEIDDDGIFNAYGWVDDYYRKINNDKITADFNFTSQIEKHLFEAGAGITLGTQRYYSIRPVGLAFQNAEFISPSGDTIAAKTKYERYVIGNPYRYGYNIYGEKDGGVIDDEDDLPAKNPMLGYAFIQDRFELEDIVLNLGLRIDYFDSKADIIADPANPYSGGSDPDDFDPGDFKTKESELYFSPRIGIGFPVTESTVFHAQYGSFVQVPRLIDLYSFQRRLDLLKSTSSLSVATGYIESEVTTQYEVGFRQVLGNVASLNITAFYKNTKGLANQGVVNYYREPGGERLQYYSATNQDFGTVKGFAFSLAVSRTNYFSLSFDYTFSISEGTGSSSNSSFVAAFRNDGDEVPKVIAPLEFDQRHTGILILDFYVPKGELAWAEMLGANFLVSFSSGRPYTPLETQNLLQGDTNWGNTKGYVNSAYGPGNFRVDFKLEKSFPLGSTTLITPYLWVENLFETVTVVDVWRSTGSPYTTDYLNTELGKKLSIQNGEGWVEDYKSLERDPSNFGIPRLIRLGLKINFASL
ncbi:MAG: carboxypeptidase-like regulatory domain-containing protein [Melioribacteraceae bacterium]|nr:carboxypeptidase-like regulatory domain-containing protein [Melioribacteraceae bacterium]